MQSLSANQKKFLKGLAHKMEPKVHVGKNGLTAAISKEVERQVVDLELIKIRVENEDREERKAIVDTIVKESGAALVQSIGKVAIIFRRNEEEPVVKLPRK